MPTSEPESLPPKYRDKDTLRFAAGETPPSTEGGSGGSRVKRFQGVAQQAYRRLEILEAATSIADLMNLPSNHFEALGGTRAGQYSIRINRQWRICFEWSSNQAQPYNIEITDYH